MRLDVIGVGGEHCHVTHLARVLDAYEADRVEQAALVGDRCGHLRERAGPVLEPDANCGAEGRREVLGVRRMLADGFHGHGLSTSSSLVDSYCLLRTSERRSGTYCYAAADDRDGALRFGEDTAGDAPQQRAG